MHFLNWYDHTLLITKLTKGMCHHVAVADTFPSPSIPTAYSRISVILLVALVLITLVLLTVPTLSEIRTTGNCTGILGFSWHFTSSFLSSDITKASVDFSNEAL
jgi:hypothetical protein